MKKYLLILPAALLAACMATGPQKALDELATAMENNQGQAFLAHIDMPAFATNYIKNMTQDDDTLSSLNALGQMFGLGNVNELIGSVFDMQKHLADKLNRGVSSGELMAECSQATTPDCPWVPRSLREATVVELGPGAAIAKVTTPARLTSWLALRKVGDKWLVVGQAVLETTARTYATAPASGDGQVNPQNTSGPAATKI